MRSQTGINYNHEAGNNTLSYEQIPAYEYTNGFWAALRALALSAPIFLGSLTCKTPPAHPILGKKPRTNKTALDTHRVDKPSLMLIVIFSPFTASGLKPSSKAKNLVDVYIPPEKLYVKRV
jgi:hypothetical protein